MERLSRCTRPPTGWHCTRAAGHDGPCAAEQNHLLPPDSDWEDIGRTGAVILIAAGAIACAVLLGIVGAVWWALHA